MIKVIAFDLDDTLWEVRPVILRAEKILGSWLSEHAPTVTFNVEEMRHYREQLMHQDPSLAGKLTELRRRVIEHAIRQSQLPDEEAARLSQEAMEVFLRARNEIELFEGAMEMLTTLSRSYTLGALSNGNADIRRVGLDHLFDFAYSAEQVGAPKPEPHLFEAALQHTGVDPRQMVYVGDDPHLDVDAARQAGLRTVWVRRPGKSPGRHTADATIDHVTELPGAINRLLNS
ncbi:MAG: HAD family hydrolase [Pseudomonadales bacterium]|nr:HAD family hydrolase [Pseudomonadales bacterium]